LTKRLWLLAGLVLATLLPVGAAGEDKAAEKKQASPRARFYNIISLDCAQDGLGEPSPVRGRVRAQDTSL
jgi:hypothetical protein